MTDTLTSLLASGDWVDLVVLLIVVAASMIGSLGKWIAQRINEKKTAQIERRRETETLMSRESTRPALERAKPLHPAPLPDREPPPPLAAPLPRAPRRPMKPVATSPVGESNPLEKVFETIFEQATGMKLERESPTPAPTPVRPARKPRQRPAPSPRPMTIAERERRQAARIESRQTVAQQESQRMAERAQSFARRTEHRLGTGETGNPESSHDAPDQTPAPRPSRFAPRKLRAAFVWSEILAPPLALRDDPGRVGH